MKLVRTAKIKLNISVDEVLPTIQAYTKAFNFVCATGYEKKDKNGVSLHQKTYQETREYLPSQLAISARMKATEALSSIFAQKKSGKSKNKYPACPVSKSCSIRYDARSYSLFLESGEVSILTVSGRKRLPLEVPAYYKEYFTWKSCSADLCINKNKVYLHIVFEKEINDTPSTGSFVGIDRGINNLAVSSNNQFFGGGVIKKQVRKYQRLRSALQKAGTKSAKRHLRRLSKKERRFRADINHQISKEIIASLNPGDTIVLENLTGIRNKRLRKPQRTLLNNWSFFQLEQFFTYKAEAKGISVVHVDARYTSQGCSACGFVDRKNRDGNNFCCRECGFSLNADLNASRNIVIKHRASYTDADRALVNEPIVGAETLLTSIVICSRGN
jgi:IS605 OrfB family transposase